MAAGVLSNPHMLVEEVQKQAISDQYSPVGSQVLPEATTEYHL